MTRDLCISKGGRFFSKICSKKFEDRTKRQRLFIDKLELLEGKAPAELTPEEEKTVREQVRHQPLTIVVIPQIDEEVVAVAFLHVDEVDDLDLIARTSRTFPV